MSFDVGMLVHLDIISAICSSVTTSDNNLCSLDLDVNVKISFSKAGMVAYCNSAALE